MSGNNGFTKTERRILDLLSDGMPHSRQELRDCLDDELSEYTAAQMHLSRIRRRIRAVGEDIICEFYKRSLYYRHVRLLNSPYDGRS